MSSTFVAATARRLANPYRKYTVRAHVNHGPPTLASMSSATDEYVTTMRYQAILFDFDGTLTTPGNIDFTAMKRDIGCPPVDTILEYIDTLDAHARDIALNIVDQHETDAAAASGPNRGAEQMVHYLRDRGIDLGIITRNSREAVITAFSNFTTIGIQDFAIVVSRDDAPPKPHPGGVLMAAQAIGIEPHAIMMVGDYRFDIEAGHRAGTTTVYITNGEPLPNLDVQPDHVIDELSELKAILNSES